MQFETTTYTVCAHFIPAIINGDATGLDPEDYKALERWFASEGLTERSGHFDCDCDGETSFAMCDITSLRGDTVELRFLEHVQTDSPEPIQSSDYTAIIIARKTSATAPDAVDADIFFYGESVGEVTLLLGNGDHYWADYMLLDHLATRGDSVRAAIGAIVAAVRDAVDD